MPIPRTPTSLKHLPLRRCMSVHHPTQPQKTSIASLQSRKHTPTTTKGSSTPVPITMLTAYDYPTAHTISHSHPRIDITLVGDSLAQVALGLPDTTRLTMDQMVHHASAVRRGTTHPLLVVDMPFGSYHTSHDTAVSNAVRFVQEAGVDGVKMEGGREIVGLVRRLTGMGIPVMAHVGLMPQRHVAMSGYRVQGKDLQGAERVWADARALQDAGAFAMVLEAVPAVLARYVTEKLDVPTIGIGAGPWTSGQVLVWDDIMSTVTSSHKPKFVRRFADVQSVRKQGIAAYAQAVQDRSFPHETEESYKMDQSIWEQFLERRRAEEEGEKQKS